MARILYAWELGGDLGHISTALPLLLALRARGHEVAVALKDLSQAQAVLGQHGIAMLQAPVWLEPPKNLPDPPLSYAEILLRFGYLEATGLHGLVNGWQTLYRALQPQLLIADHAPTALLAARGLPLATAMFGTGFCSPPRVTPMPNMRPWLTVQEARLAEREARALASANGVLAALSAAPLTALADLFRGVGTDLLATFPELDHYPERGDARYFGPVLSPPQGILPQWPEGEGKKVFAYLKPAYGRLQAVLDELAQSPCRALVYCSGVTPALLSRYDSPRFRFSAAPFDMDAAARECDAAICHSGHGTTSALLLAGRPLLLLPMQLEQFLLSSAVKKLGAAVVVHPEVRDEDIPGKCRRLLADDSLAAQAKAFAGKYRAVTQEKILDAMAAACEDAVMRAGGQAGTAAPAGKRRRG